jgi:hypothetical protein
MSASFESSNPLGGVQIKLFDLVKVLSMIEDLNGKNLEESVRLSKVPSGGSSGKYEPTLKALRYFNLIDFSFRRGEFTIYRTELGKFIHHQDPFLNDPIYYLLFWYFICGTETGNILFHLVSNQLLGKNNDDVVIDKERLNEVFEGGSRQKKDKRIAVFNILNIISAGAMVEREDDGCFKFSPLPLSDQNLGILAFCLHDLWTKSLQKQCGPDNEISTEKLEEIHPVFRRSFHFTMPKLKILFNSLAERFPKSYKITENYGRTIVQFLPVENPIAMYLV